MNPVIKMAAKPQSLAEARAQRAVIERELSWLPAPCTVTGRRLIEVTLRFLDSPFWPQAIEAGWTLPELFGVDPWAPLVRVEHAGIATSAALSPFKGAKLVEITSDAATYQLPRGGTLVDRRNPSRRAAAILWWRSSLIGEASEADAVGEIAA